MDVAVAKRKRDDHGWWVRWREDSRNSEVFWGFGMPLFLAAWKSLFAAAWLQLSGIEITKSMTLAYTGWPEYHHHLRWKASENEERMRKECQNVMDLEVSKVVLTSKRLACWSLASATSELNKTTKRVKRCVWYVMFLHVVKSLYVVWKHVDLRLWDLRHGLVQDPVRIFHATTTSLSQKGRKNRNAERPKPLNRNSLQLWRAAPLKCFLPSCGYLERSPLWACGDVWCLHWTLWHCTQKSSFDTFVECTECSWL